MARSRIPFLVVAVLALLLGLLTGIWRSGWLAPFPHPTIYAHHAALMVAGFLGTLISLERAIAFGKRWAYLAPGLAGLSTALLFSPRTVFFAASLQVLASGVLVAVALVYVKKFPSLHMAVMAAGAVAWLTGNLWWITGLPYHRFVLWWAGFLILTIVGERLELSRILQPKGSAIAVFLLAFLLFSAGMLVSVLTAATGMVIAGAGLVLFSLWLLRHDLARRSVHQPGQHRFIGIALLLGYAWLGIAGVFLITWNGSIAGFHYDAMLHAIFLGFVFSMIFAHAPIIFPAILHVQMRFSRRFYLHLALLHLSLLIRLAGDILLAPDVRIVGSVLNAVAILWFFANTVASIRLQPAAE